MSCSAIVPGSSLYLHSWKKCESGTALLFAPQHSNPRRLLGSLEGSCFAVIASARSRRAGTVLQPPPRTCLPAPGEGGSGLTGTAGLPGSGGGSDPTCQRGPSPCLAAVSVVPQAPSCSQ